MSDIRVFDGMTVDDLPLADLISGGLDLGTQQDYSALVLAEYHPRYLIARAIAELEESDEVLLPEYRVRVLPRWPLGSTSTQIAKSIRRIVRSPGLRGKDFTLAVDTTGPGEGVRDTFERFGVFGRHVIITGGLNEKVVEGRDRRVRWHVAKELLLSPLRAMSEPDNKRLHILDSTDEARTLIDELKSFKPSASMRNVKTEEDLLWRETAHDDLVLACALAIWNIRRVPQGDIDENLVSGGPPGMFEPLSDDELFRPPGSFF